MKTKFCPNCGAECAAETNFCATCGHHFVKRKEQLLKSAVFENENTFKQKPKKSMFGLMGKILLGLVILFAVGLIVLLALDDSFSSGSKADVSNVKKIISNVGEHKAIIGNLNENAIQISIPEQTFEQEVKIEVEALASYPELDDKRATIVGIPFEISIDQESKRLRQPVYTKIKISDDDLSAVDSPKDLWMAYYNGKEWDFFKPIDVNTEENYIAFQTYHFSKYIIIDPEKRERIDAFAYENAVNRWASKGNNKIARGVTKQMVQKILKQKLGLNDKSLTQDIVEAIMKENDYTKLLLSYKEGKMGDFGQDLAVLTGKIIVKVVSEDSNAKALLGKITGNASKIGTGIQVAVYLYEGKLEDAAKNITKEIINNVPILKLFTTAASVIDTQVTRWKNEELEAAYRVYVDGAESSIPWWGYQVEPGNFDAVWDQMKGLQTKLIDDQIKLYAVSRGINVDRIGVRMHDIIANKVKKDLKQEFIKRQKEEGEIEKIKERNAKLIEAFISAGLLREGKFGYTKHTTFDFRLERLFRVKDMILKDTKSRIGFSGINEGGIISAKRVALLIMSWYSKPNGKQKYREQLIAFGYIKEKKVLELEDGPWEITIYEAKTYYNALTGILNESTTDFAYEMSRMYDEDHEASSAEIAWAEGEEERERKEEDAYTKACKALDKAYQESLGKKVIDAPKAVYRKEEDEEDLFLDQYNLKLKNGLYYLTIKEGDSQTRMILDLKSKDYFEAKVFISIEDFIVEINYYKGKLK